MEYLVNHPQVENVNHPSLPDHPDHAVYERYFPNGGASIFTFEISQMPGSENLKAGQNVVLYTAAGQPVPVKVTARDDTTITFDANHEMAGKELNFHIELLEVQ